MVGDAETCLNERVLHRVRPEEIHDDCQPNDSRGDCQPLDEANPGYWYLPPKSGSGSQDYSFHYWMPSDISCEKCTLQWAWKTANSCTPHPDAYKCHSQNMARLGWDAASWCSGVCSFQGACPAVQAPPTPCGEEFANCADLTIVHGGAQELTSSPTPRPSPPSVLQPEPEAEPEPEPESQPEPEPTPAPTHGASCTGKPCGMDSQCRSEWGYCGSSTAYCNAKSTWTANGCSGAPSRTDVPTPLPTPSCAARLGNVAGVTDAFCNNCGQVGWCRSEHVFSFCEGSCGAVSLLASSGDVGKAQRVHPHRRFRGVSFIQGNVTNVSRAMFHDNELMR